MATLLMAITVKATVVLAAAWLLTRVMARHSAASRHLVWTLAMVGVLAVPVMQLAAPSWKLPVLPPDGVRPQYDSTQGSDPGDNPYQGVDTTRVMGSDPMSRGVGDVMAAPIAVTNTPPSRQPAMTIDWRVALGLAWLTGVLVALTRLVAGLVWVRRVTGRATDVTDADWQDVLVETTAALRVTSDVQLKMSAKTTTPVACGLWTPTVLLPMEAARWTAERRRVVLLHEIAHVARRDCLVQTLAQMGRALHWFNPLAHVAVARLRAEQERACDDLVLAAGTDAPAYADHLFEIARTFRSGSCPAWATLAMARPSQLEGRVLAILDDRKNRRVPKRWVRAAVAASAAALTLPIGVLQLTAAAPPAVIDEPRLLSAGERVAASAALEIPDAAPAAPARIEWNEKTLVEGASELVDVVGDAFDFDFDVDVDPDVDAGQSQSQTQSRSQSSSSSATSSQNPQPAPNPNQNTTVTDETRRRVADALMTALNDENADVREQALNALANMRDPRAIPGLLRALRDMSVDVREQAVNALAMFDTQEAIDGVVSALKDQSADVREHAARHVAALGVRGRLNDAKYIELVAGLLKDASPDVREMAVMAMGRLRRPEAVPQLLPLLKDANEDVREQAAHALGYLADPRAIDALTGALKDQTPDVREAAAIALGRIARGERRGTTPRGVAPAPPVPPVPPAPPRVPGVKFDGPAPPNIEKAVTAAEAQMKQSFKDLVRSLDELDQQKADLKDSLR